MERDIIKVLNIIGHGTHEEERVIRDLDTLLWVVEFFKKEGKRIVYTGGVYDLFHIGHALYLEKAKQQGDILIVGVDSDALAGQRKDPTRPIVKLEERISILIRNRAVDIVIVRHENDDPFMLVKKIKPHVLVMSQSTKDTPIEEMRAAYKDDIGELIVFEPQATTSTSARIGQLMQSGASELNEKIQAVLKDHFKLDKKGGGDDKK